MPFINAVAYNNRPLIRPILLLDVTKDVLVLCTNLVSLTATVQGSVLGHTIEWTQLTGSPVTFIGDPASTDISFLYSDREDKIFRFYIDKNTGRDQFKDVLVSSTIADTPNLYTSAPPPGITNGYNYATEMAAMNPTVIPGSEYGAVLYNSSAEASLVWNVPAVSYPEVYSKLEIYRKQGADLILVGSVVPPSTTITPSPILYNDTSTYVVRMYIDSYGTNQVVNSYDMLLYPTPTGQSGLAAKDEAAYTSVSSSPGSVNNFQTQLLELTSQTVADTVLDMSASFYTGSVSYTQTQILTLYQLDTNADVPIIQTNLPPPGLVSIFQMQLSSGIFLG